MTQKKAVESERKNDSPIDKEEDRIAQQAITSRALRSIAILEKSFIKRASGRYVLLHPNSRFPSQE